MEAYSAVLEAADAWYRDVKARHPDRVPCARGCRECCLGLFDITPADAALLRDGLATLDDATRCDIERRAADIMTRLRASFPELVATLDGLSEERIDAICEALGPVECPVLGRENECRLYAHRPLTCRLAGAPVVDVSGETICAEACTPCTLRPEDAPRIDYAELRRLELDVLRRVAPGHENVTMLIPQVFA